MLAYRKSGKSLLCQRNCVRNRIYSFCKNKIANILFRESGKNLILKINNGKKGLKNGLGYKSKVNSTFLNRITDFSNLMKNKCFVLKMFKRSCTLTLENSYKY